MLKTLKKLGRKRKTRGAREQVIKVAVFVAKGIKGLFKQLRSTLLSVHSKKAKTGPETTIEY